MRRNSVNSRGTACAATAVAWAIACICQPFLSSMLWSQAMDDSIVAKHVRLRIPVERQWLGREAISDLERCWAFLQGATGGKLPGRVQVVIEWQDATSAVDADRGMISIGMNHPAAAKDLKGFLLHSATRELARLALLNLSGRSVSKEQNRFLSEGMAEMLAHDFSNTTRKLGAAWAICYYLDRINPLGLKQLSNRPDLFSTQDLRSASPGITFLTACRDLFGRVRVLKLFESLAKKNLEDSLAAAFRPPVSALETNWLNRVRSYTPADVTITAEEQAPVLDRVVFVPEQAKAGATLGMQLFTRDVDNDLLPAGIFVVDESSGKVMQGVAARSAAGSHTVFEIPIDPSRQAGQCRLRVIAVDEGGNIRNWEAMYSVVR
jgi:hypothetical protein